MEGRYGGVGQMGTERKEEGMEGGMEMGSEGGLEMGREEGRREQVGWAGFRVTIRVGNCRHES